MPTRLETLVVDAADPHALARWWAEALGWTITVQEPYQVAIQPPEPDGLGVPLVFVAVADPKVGKNRVHLGLPNVSDDDQAALAAGVPSGGHPGAWDRRGRWACLDRAWTRRTGDILLRS